MSASVTNDLRNFLLDHLRSDVLEGDSSSGNYYVAIGRSTDFTSGTSVTSREEQFKFRNSMQMVKVLSNASFVIPTVTWQSNDTYEAYSERDPNQTRFYVVNSNNEVFICIDSPNTPSTVEPTSSLANHKPFTFNTSDGYYWRYMYTMSNLAYNNFRTNKYTPVKKVTGVTGLTRIPQEEQQLRLQDSAVDGEILRLQIDSAGIDYPGIAPIMISGNGTGASFTADLDGSGSIVSVTVDSDAGGLFKHGFGYDYAAADPIGGDGVLTPVFAPKGGLNADPVVSLKSKSLMLQVDVQGNEKDTLLTENDFRQVALIRDPKIYDSDGSFVANTGIAMKSFNLTPLSATGTFAEDTVFSTSIGSATGKVFFHDVPNDILYYYQDLETEFEPFTNGLSITDGSVTASILSQNNPDIDPYSGDILYLNNISAVDRSEDQTEDIRIVIELG